MKKKGCKLHTRYIIRTSYLFIPRTLRPLRTVRSYSISVPSRPRAEFATALHSITSACFILSIYISFCQYVAFKNTLFYQNFFFFFWQCSFPHTHDTLSLSSLENLTILFAIWQCAVNQTTQTYYMWQGEGLRTSESKTCMEVMSWIGRIARRLVQLLC